MVVLEALPVTTSSGVTTSTMLTASNSNGQYINPDDILNPLASNDMDPKSSPLAMLAKTCSQIGADPPLPTSKVNKPKTPPSDQVKKDSVSPPISSKDSRSRSSSAEIRVTDTLSKSDTKTSAPNTPTVRPGIEVLAPTSLPTTPRAVPPTVSYPATVPSISVSSSSSSSSALQNNPFLASFANQLSPPSDTTLPGVCRDPLCRDPLCPTALRNQQFMGGYSYANLLASSPHYRETMMIMAAQQRMLAASMATSPHTNGALPHVCGWMLGSEYCGRRFATAEELLIHLKTHTNLSTSDPRALLSATTNNSASSGPRFHPYARLSPGMSPTLGPAPPSAPLPPPPSLSLAALASSPYASLYSSLFSRPPLL